MGFVLFARVIVPGTPPLASIRIYLEDAMDKAGGEQAHH